MVHSRILYEFILYLQTKLNVHFRIKHRALFTIEIFVDGIFSVFNSVITYTLVTTECSPGVGVDVEGACCMCVTPSVAGMKRMIVERWPSAAVLQLHDFDKLSINLFYPSCAQYYF